MHLDKIKKYGKNKNDVTYLHNNVRFLTLQKSYLPGNCSHPKHCKNSHFYQVCLSFVTFLFDNTEILLILKVYLRHAAVFKKYYKTTAVLSTVHSVNRFYRQLF